MPRERAPEHGESGTMIELHGRRASTLAACLAATALTCGGWTAERESGIPADQFGRLHKQIKGHFSNETAIVTPNGEMLSPYPEEGLQKWRQLSRAKRRAVDDLGKYDVRCEPSPPAGGLVLNVFARPLVRDPGGDLEIYR